MQAIENQIILVTGATDGLGKRVAGDLAGQDATVLLHGRNREKGQKVLREVKHQSNNKNLTYYNADFSSLDEVSQLAKEIKNNHEKLDVLINNAGIGSGEASTRQTSRDGYELLFQVNYLSAFLLTQQLLPLLSQSSPARIVNVASGAQQAINFEDVMLKKNYSGKRAYSQSKLALVMYTFELADRLDSTEITANTLHPATFMNTKMVRQSDISPETSVDKGARAVEYLAISDDVNEITGQFFDGKQQARADSQAYKKEARQRLWELSEHLVNN